MKTFIVLFSIIAIVSFSEALSHGKKNHKEKSEIQNTSKSIDSTEQFGESHSEEQEYTGQRNEEEKYKIQYDSVIADIGDFPTLHPLVVHFPIVLLIIAFFSQIFGFFIFKNELGIITLVLLTAGFIGAYFSANIFHPHTEELSLKASMILDGHEAYAEYTVWLSGIAALLKAVNVFFLKRNTLVEFIIALIMIFSVISVGITGHYGAQLIHIEGVGVQGKYLELDNHEH